MLLNCKSQLQLSPAGHLAYHTQRSQICDLRPAPYSAHEQIICTDHGIPPTPPRKSRRWPGLSFEALASIDLIGLLDRTSSAVQSSSPDDDGQATPPLDEAPLPLPSDDPIAWSVDPPFYSIREAAAWLGVSLATMKRLLSRGALPYVRAGARRKIPLFALRAYAICARHIGCYLYLKRRPGDYETMRRVLAQRNIETTARFYAEMEKEEAFRMFNRVMLELRESHQLEMPKPAKPKGLEKAAPAKAPKHVKFTAKPAKVPAPKTTESDDVL